MAVRLRAFKRRLVLVGFAVIVAAAFVRLMPAEPPSSWKPQFSEGYVPLRTTCRSTDADLDSQFTHLKLGEPAPDLQLIRLKHDVETAEGIASGGDADYVSLSSFRGKKVVCLFLSSYT